jgi:hypothetical protein
MTPPVVNRTELLVLIARRRSEFRSFVGRRVPPGVDPGDVLQEALLLATRGVGSLRDPERAVPWFYRVLVVGAGIAALFLVSATSVLRDGLRALRA